ncbi:MAG: cysteine dioxygenase [Actinocrinis sp.]
MTANRSDTSASVSASPTPFETPDLPDLLARARGLAAEPGLVARLATRPDQRTWLPLDAGPGTRAWLIAWPPGTGTGWHDHGGASGAMVAVEGELTERSVEAPRRHDYGQPLPLPGGVGSVRTLPAGEGRAFSGRHIHEVTSESDRIAFSVHVYAPNLNLMRHYAVDGENLLLVGVETEQSW